MAATAPAEGSSSRGRVFVAATATHAIVVVTTAQALPGPTRRDVLVALSALGGESAQQTPFTTLQDAVVNAAITLVHDTFRRHSAV
jgi:hypothetical protein